ncbi:MAG: hypothetical protein ACD_33C00046G0014 [uncultured bacterium]|nr:MAG: hypothetical protein ACD_33C00046G0014 [uncultured bacterium]
MSNIERDPRFREDCFNAGMIGVDEQSAFYGLWKIAVARGNIEAVQSTSPNTSPIATDSTNNDFVQLQILLSELYAGKDWHKLTRREELLCKLLEDAGYLVVNNPPNGFIGKAKLPDVESNIDG